MGRTGVCWDNALAESFFAALKNELVHRTIFPTRERARQAIAEYIEVFYNRQRLHSGLDYKTPLEVTIEYQQNRSLAARPQDLEGRPGHRPVQPVLPTKASSTTAINMAPRGRVIWALCALAWSVDPTRGIAPRGGTRQAW
jgi:hypothetical protein